MQIQSHFAQRCCRYSFVGILTINVFQFGEKLLSALKMRLMLSYGVRCGDLSWGVSLLRSFPPMVRDEKAKITRDNPIRSAPPAHYKQVPFFSAPTNVTPFNRA